MAQTPRADLGLQVKEPWLWERKAEGREQAGHGPWSLLPTIGGAPVPTPPQGRENQRLWPLPGHPLQCLEHFGER